MDISSVAPKVSVSPNLPNAPDPVKKASKDFEAAFLGMVVNEMMKGTMPETMNGGQGEEMFRSLLGNEIGKQIAQSGGIGIATSVEEKMRAYQK